MTTFLRALHVPVDAKAQALKAAIARRDSAAQSFILDPAVFSDVPGSPFAYWIDTRIRRMFSDRPKFAADGEREVRLGASTKHDARFVRLWHEPRSLDSEVWSTYANGGRFGRFFQDYFTIVRSGQDFKELGAYLVHKFPYLNGEPGWILHLENDYSQPAIGWPLRTHAFSPHALPANTVFSARTYATYVPQSQLSSIGALLASQPVDFLLKAMLGRSEHPEFVTGVVRSLPWLTEKLPSELEEYFRKGWRIARKSARTDEKSRHFLLPHSLQCRVSDVEDPRDVQQAIDDLAFELYGLDTGQRAAIGAWLSREGDEADAEASEDSDVSEDVEATIPEDEPEVEPGGSEPSGMLSWLIGVSFGRFDPRLVTGERAIPPEPEPFDPLPSRSPGMYPEGEEPADRPDILVDDEGHPKDLTALVQRWAEHVGDEVLADLRPWLAREFFPLHIKMYSKSRRKAPIYWQLATPSASYSVWLYIHAFTKDTLFRVQNDYFAPKLAHEERQLETLRAEAGPDPVAAQRKAIEAQEAFVEELRAFLDEVKRVAPLWNPNLDDGVIINFAPFWRLVPHHKPWQKELKATWAKLCAGECDWAHLAMHFWPERVVPKCAEDRSLAIAHDLEDVFWYQDEDEKWKPREEPTTPIDALVKERTSSAVKAALKSLMDAPEQSGVARRGRGRR